MADKTAHKNDAPAQDATPQFVMPSGLTNLAARYPLYDGGDARTGKVGTRGAPIHGYLLGTIELPSVLKDPKSGEDRAWNGIVVELLQPCPVKEKNGEEETKRWAKKGERIIVTESKVLEGYSRAADHPTKVYEALIEFVIGKTKAGQSLWNIPTFAVGKPLPRTESHMVALKLEEPSQSAHLALPAGSSAASLPVS